MKKTKYGLRLKKNKEIITYSSTYNEEYGSCYCLGRGDSAQWLVDSKMIANYVKNISTPYYNAGYNSPTHNFKANDLEVIKVIIVEIIAVVEEEKLPTHIVLLEELGKKDKGKLYHAQKIREGVKYLPYSLYDLKEYYLMKAERLTASK